MNIPVGCLSVESLFKGEDGKEKFKLVIPDFQRPYDWNEEQVEQLLEDLIEAYETYKSEGREGQYLLGNLVFLEDGNGEKIWKIVDGQQRIITLL